MSVEEVREQSEQYKPCPNTLYKNPDSIDWKYITEYSHDNYIHIKDAAFKFHQQFTGYKPSRLIKLDSNNGVEVYVKEECERFGLPSFKMLGTGWGIFRVLCDKCNLECDSTSLDQLKALLFQQFPNIELVACTDGNHGRAVARMAKLLGIESSIFVPRNVLNTECTKIRNEGAKLTKLNGNYDFAIQFCSQFIKTSSNYVWIQDFGYEDYTTIPVWIADGYSTMCREIPFDPKLIVVPCGSGCLPHGITAYYRSYDSGTHVMLAEPLSAHTVNKSLTLKQPSSDTGDSFTIMDGLNCPTVSKVAFPVLLNGVSFSCLVNEDECVDALAHLNSIGINSGPCGAISYAAFIKQVDWLLQNDVLQKGDKIVLLSTEASREFKLRGKSYL